MIAELGPAEGIQLTQKLFVGALRRSVDIPTSLIAVLATDDDDGNLANGTPHECTIRNAYAQHGLRTATGTVVAPDHLAQPTLATTVHVELSGLATRCSGDEVDHAELEWKFLCTAGPPDGTAVAVQTGPATFYAELPLKTDTTTCYQAKAVFKDGSVLTLPDNRADPFYQLYTGRTVPLYCTDFEAGDPMMAGWQTGTNNVASAWSWGVPAGGATDPPAAFSGSHALVQALGGDYAAKSSAYVKMPPIAIGQWSDVHLQYRRWLAVEDSQFDQARITVGDQDVWVNATEYMGDNSALQHIDREWRFQDVAVSGVQPGHTLDIGWDLTSDEGLEFGGWAIDDVCVVANVASVCGDGVVTASEVCDDGPGNADRPNACRTWCQLPTCGDGIVDDGEECDVGSAGNSDCTASCQTVKAPGLGGCCSAERDAGGPCALGALVLGLVLRRRRRPLL